MEELFKMLDLMMGGQYELPEEQSRNRSTGAERD